MSTQPALDPLVIRRAFLLATRQLFGYPENYGVLQPLLGKFVYRDDDSSSLPVRLDFDYSPEMVGGSTTPTIWVGMGDLKLQQSVINNQAAMLPANSGYARILRAQTQVAIKCISRNADEAQGLATIAAVHFAGLQQLFLDQLRLQNMQVQQIGRPQLVDKVERMISCDCTIAIDFSFTLNTMVEGHRLKTLQLSLVPLTGA